ncbi:MAG: hypothetical protein NTY03_00780 [Candidatus Bathyarchaeota archaeon]|nr:hypothetical protein [Candidatus Bathyarchaeota archaeon]
MEIKLTAINRLTLLELLRLKGSPFHFKILYDFRMAIGFTEKETTDYPKIEVIVVEVGDNIRTIVSNILIILKETGNLTEEQKELYVIFVEE